MGNILTQERHNRAGQIFDDLEYKYQMDDDGNLLRNRLYSIKDDTTLANVMEDDIEDMDPFISAINQINTHNNYSYDAEGRLVKDKQEEIETIIWSVSGKVKEIRRNSDSNKKNLIFDYDAMGNRIAKHVYDNQTLMLEKSTYVTNCWISSIESLTIVHPDRSASESSAVTFFSLTRSCSVYFNEEDEIAFGEDAQGNQLSMYEHQVDPVNSATMYYLTGRNIYGSSRLGTINDTLNMFIPDNLPSYGILGNRNYELSNHLGNVLMVINDIIYPLSADNTTIDSYEVGISNIFDYSPFGAPLDGRTIENIFYQASTSVDTVKQTIYVLEETFDVASDWQATTSYTQITYPSGKMRVRNSSTTKRTIGARKNFVTGEGLHEVSFDISSLPSFICEYQPPFPPIGIGVNSDSTTTTSGVGGNATLNVVVKNQNNVIITSGSYNTTGTFTNLNFTAVEGDTYTIEFYINNACKNTFFEVDNVSISYEEVIITQTVYALEETFDVASDWQATTSYTQITYPSGKMRVRNSSTTKRTIGAKKSFVTGEGLHEVSFDIVSLPSPKCRIRLPIRITSNSDSTTTSGIGGNATLNVVVKNQNNVIITSGSYNTTGNFTNLSFTAVEGDTYTIEFYINNACDKTFFQVDNVFISHKEEVNIETGNFIVSGGYRYGFNGQERDDEVAGAGNSYTAEFWQYDPRLGRRWNIDPVVKPHESPYATFANNPIWFVDLYGADTSFFDDEGKYDQQAKDDFIKAYNTVRNKLDHLSESLESNLNAIKALNIDDRRGRKEYQKLKSERDGLLSEYADWALLSMDFQVIMSELFPTVTYSTNVSNLKPEEQGKTIANYNSSGNLTSALVTFRSGKYSTVVHENRHVRQSRSMSKLASEVQAYRFQQIYSYLEVQERISNALKTQYPDADFHPLPNQYGIIEMVKYVYKIE